MVIFAGGRVLHSFLAGNRQAAGREPKRARARNLYVELFLSGQIPDTYTLGGKEEALVCFDRLGVAWANNGDALFWLLDQLYSQMYVGAKSKGPEEFTLPKLRFKPRVSKILREIYRAAIRSYRPGTFMTD